MRCVVAVDLMVTPGPATPRGGGPAPAERGDERGRARTLNQRRQTAIATRWGSPPQSHQPRPRWLRLSKATLLFPTRAAGARMVPCHGMPSPGSSGHGGWGLLGACSALAKHARRIEAAGSLSLKKSLKLNSYILIRYPALPELVIECLLFHVH